MKHRWLAATALVSLLALSPALAQEQQQEQETAPQMEAPQPQQQQPRQQQPGQQQPGQQQPEQRPEGQQPGQQPETMPEQQPETMPDQQPGQQPGQVPQEEGPPPEGQTSADGLTGMSEAQLLGKELYDSRKKRIGQIDQVVQGSGGQVEAVVLEVGGFLGIGGKKVAVPAYQIQTEGDRIVTSNLTARDVEQLPEFQQAGQQPGQDKRPQR